MKEALLRLQDEAQENIRPEHVAMASSVSPASSKPEPARVESVSVRHKAEDQEAGV